MTRTIDEAAAGERPDMREMLMVHRVFRRDLAGAAAQVRAVPAGDAARVGLLAGHVRLLLQILELHHGGEDEFVWPLLLERAPADAELVQTMESQHAAVASGLERAHEQLEEWESTADPAHGERLAVTLSQMATALLEHLDAEEAHVLALIEAHLSAQEWGKLGEHGMAGVNEQQRPIVIGMFLEDMPDDERAAFVSKLPPQVQQLWRDVWSPAYADYVKAVREPV